MSSLNAGGDNESIVRVIAQDSKGIQGYKEGPIEGTLNHIPQKMAPICVPVLVSSP